MSIPPILLEHLVESLEILQDKETQIRAWTGADEQPLSYIETICGLFEDSGFNDAIEKGEASPFLGDELTNLLLQIGNLVERIDVKSPLDIAELPEMEEIRHLSQQALRDPIFKRKLG